MNHRPWDDVATVRTAPVRTFDTEAGKVFFPPSLFKALEHPRAVEGEPERTRALAAHRLLLYLDFTTALESLIVNPVLVSLGTGRLMVELRQKDRTTAWEIYVDEAYHALSAVRLANQVAHAAKITRDLTVDHSFRQVVDRHLESAVIDPELIRFASAVVSETLISGTLEILPRDNRVHTAIRESVRDHEQDERRHHAYFASIFPGVWEQLGRKEAEVLAPMMAEFIRAFLEPDTENLLCVARSAMEDGAVAKEMIDEIASDPDLDARVRHSARATLKLLRKSGVLDHAVSQERFEELALTER